MREAFEGVLTHARGRVLALNPAAERLLGVDAERVRGKPLIHALRDRRLLRLAEEGGEAELEVRGRRLLVRAVKGRLYLLERPPDERAELEHLRHELRTPVAAIVGLLEVFEGLPEEEQKEVLSLLKREAARLFRLVEAGDYQGAVPPYPLAGLKPRLERVFPAARELGWRVGEVRLRVDEDAVFQVLLNLVENAFKHGQPPVTLVAQPEGDALLIEVRDRGPVLDDYERLFLPGARGQAAAHARGSGLGLSIVRRIARSLGGEAYARRVGEENAFGIRIPEGLWLPG